MHADQVVHRLSEEAGAGHGGHFIICNHPLAELKVAPAFKLRQGEKIGNIYEDKVASLGHRMGKADIRKAAAEEIPLFRVQLF